MDDLLWKTVDWIRKRPKDFVVALVLLLILIDLSWAAHIIIIPIAVAHPTFDSVILFVLGVMGWAFRQEVWYFCKAARWFFHELRVNVWLRISRKKPDGTLPDCTLELLEPDDMKEVKQKEKQHKKVPSLEQRRVASGFVCATTPPKKNGTIRKKK